MMLAPALSRLSAPASAVRIDMPPSTTRVRIVRETWSSCASDVGETRDTRCTGTSSGPLSSSDPRSAGSIVKMRSSSRCRKRSSSRSVESSAPISCRTARLRCAFVRLRELRSAEDCISSSRTVSILGADRRPRAEPRRRRPSGAPRSRCCRRRARRAARRPSCRRPSDRSRTCRSWTRGPSSESGPPRGRSGRAESSPCRRAARARCPGARPIVMGAAPVSGIDVPREGASGDDDVVHGTVRRLP